MGVFHRLLFRRMAEAKLLLETTHKSMGEIAEIAGYGDGGWFHPCIPQRIQANTKGMADQTKRK